MQKRHTYGPHYGSPFSALSQPTRHHIPLNMLSILSLLLWSKNPATQHESRNTITFTVKIVPYFFQVCYHVVVVALAAVLVVAIWNVLRDLIPIDCTTFTGRGCLCSQSTVVTELIA